MVNKIATVTDLRANLAQFLEELESGPLMVIQRSRPAGYLISAEEFEALIQRLEDLEDLIEGMETVREYLEDTDVVVDAEEVFGKLGI